MAEWQHARSYVELALSIEHHLPGYVDSYFGPAEIREAVDQKGTTDLESLRSTADRLRESVREDAVISEQRRAFLSAELGAMRTTLAILGGEQFGIIEETERLYNLTPSWIEEKVFEDAQEDLESLLPGTGSLADRMEDYRQSIVVPEDRLLPILGALTEESRWRTKALIDLPEDEQCEFAIVREKPWRAYNWYLGNYTSRIDFNVDLPFYAYSGPGIVCHEAYPGHHTERSIKDKELYRDQGNLEFSVVVCNTPSAVISEGLAEAAGEMIRSPEEMTQAYQIVIDGAGLSGVDGSQMYQITRTFKQLSKVQINRLLMLHKDGAADDDVVEYGMRYGLIDAQLSRKSLQFMKDPLWRSYGFLYPMGYEVVTKYVGKGDDRLARFARLLHEPMTVSQL